MVDRHLRRSFLGLVDGTGARHRGEGALACADCREAMQLFTGFERDLDTAMRSMATEALPSGIVSAPTTSERGWVAYVGGGLLAAAVVLLIAVVAAPRSATQPAVDPAAAAALNEVAVEAARAEPMEVGDGYVYTRSEGLWQVSYGPPTEFTYLSPVSREIWVAADGSGRLRETAGEPIFLSDADRQAWIAAGSPPTHENNIDFAPGGAAFVDVASLPADTDELRQLVQQRASQTDRRPMAVAMFIAIGELLRETAAPPDVRAALFELTASLPGIQLMGEMVDHAGRPGIGVAMTDGTMRHVFIFDPQTSAFLEEQSLGLEPYGGREPPILWGYTTYLESSVLPDLP